MNLNFNMSTIKDKDKKVFSLSNKKVLSDNEILREKLLSLTINGISILSWKLKYDLEKEEIIRNKKKTVVYVYNDNSVFGKLVENKNNVSFYMLPSFLEKNYSVVVEDITKRIMDHVDIVLLKQSMMEKDIDGFINQTSKMADIVLRKAKVHYEDFEDYKQDILLKSFKFISKIEKYKINYEKNMDIFNYVYRMCFNTFLNSAKKEEKYRKKNVFVGEVEY